MMYRLYGLHPGLSITCKQYYGLGVDWKETPDLQSAGSLDGGFGLCGSVVDVEH